MVHNIRTIKFFAFAVSILTLPVLGQISSGQSDVSTSTLIYSVNRTPEYLFETARSVKIITSDDIWRKNARTLPEILMEEAGLFVQQTNYGGGAPIIRGLIGKEILIFVDGVKINNATYRYGPIQYLSTIDLNMVERIEIVRGVESVLTSYALGGIINIITKKGPPAGDQKSTGTAFQTRYSDADNAIHGHFEVYGNNDHFRYYTGLTYRNCDDLKAGGNIGVQEWTGYDELAGNVNFDYFLSSEKMLSFAYQRLQQNDVPRTDKFGSDLLYNFEPQRLQLMKLAYQDLTPTSWYNSLQITVSLNRQDEIIERIVSSKPNTKRFYDDNQTVLGLNFEMVSFIGTMHRLLYGFDLFSEKINSKREDVDLETGEVQEKRGRWTDGATYSSFGLYLQDRLDPWKWMSLTVGGRLAYYAIKGEESSSIGDLNLDGNDIDVTGSINTVFHVTRNLNFITNVSRSFRSPNIDDVSVYDERSDGVEVPNPDVKSVKLMTYEMGLKYAKSLFSGSLFYFYSDMTDMMERSAGTLNGLSFYDENDNGIQDGDEPAILQRQNIGKAKIRGIELDMNYRFTAKWILFGNYTWTTGEDVVLNTPLSRVPPDFGSLGIRWSAQSSLRPWIEVIWHFADAQREVSPRDAGDDRIGPGGTDGFNMFNIRCGLSLINKIRLMLGLENILNEEYKYHASGVYRPGFQVVAGAEIRL